MSTHRGDRQARISARVAQRDAASTQSADPDGDTPNPSAQSTARFELADKVTLLIGDAMDAIRSLPDESVHCCVTSPPYWGLRDYGIDGQLGVEEAPGDYVRRLVDLFREVRRVLRSDGTCWLNLGDTYANAGGSELAWATRNEQGKKRRGSAKVPRKSLVGLKTKDLVGIPWEVAFAMRADGWWLRQDIVWSKPNPMPESVRDRCTRAHEYLFLLTKAASYHFDTEAAREPARWATDAESRRKISRRRTSDDRPNRLRDGSPTDGKRRRRSVWQVALQPYKGAHFAVMPEELIRPCILMGSPPDGVVLDPFSGSGTTLAVARQLGRSAIGIELNPEYLPLIRDRVIHASSSASLFQY